MEEPQIVMICGFFVEIRCDAFFKRSIGQNGDKIKRSVLYRRSKGQNRGEF